MPAEAQLRADVDGLRLRAHAASARLATWASLGVSALLLWALQGNVPTPQLVAWLLALVAAVVWRVVLPAAHRRAMAAPADLPGGAPGDGGPQHVAQRHWLRRYRLSIAAHGAVWGLAAWLPASLTDTPLQASVVFMLVGLVVGAMTLTLFDLPAALLFAGLAMGLLLLRLALIGTPLPSVTVVALVMGVLQMAMLGLAGRRADRERHGLAAARRAERASAEGIRDAKSLLQLVFDHAGQGIAVFDRSERLMAWNDQVAALSALTPAVLRRGVTLEACVRDRVQQGPLAPDAQEAEVQRRLQELRLREPGVLRYGLVDGRAVELRRDPLPDGGLVLFLADITEREASRRAADRQQRMLALVLERTEQGFWYIDNDLRTTDANPAMCRMLGLTRPQLLGRSIHDFADAENRAIFDLHAARREAGHAGGYEIALTRADGRQVHCFNNATPVFDAGGRKTGALGLFSDITDQKLAQQQVRQAGEALAQKSKVLALTLDSLAQGVLNVDAQGRCTAWNSRFLELLHFPPDLMATRPLLTDLLHWQLAHDEFGDQLCRMDDEGRASVARALQAAPASFGHRYRRTRADGTVLDVASHFAADGSLVRTYTDVTASVAAEAALIAARDEAERAREQAEAANRAKSDFPSRMSHELRTPLNAILGFAQLLQVDATDPPSAGQRQRLEALMRGGHHLLALINDVLDVARIEAGNLQLTLEPVDLARLVPDALALVQPMAQARGVVLAAAAGLPAGAGGQGAAAPAGPWVLADATRLRQVLLNLLSNAIKFNRDGGDVGVQVLADADGVWLEVSDQGAGIPPDHVPRLFQAFERLDMEGAVEGTGIGLALSRSLVALMHGTIGVRSTLGEGSVFWVRLPACQAPGGTLAGAPPPGPAPVAPWRQHDVLYIEDNEVNQVLMQGMLAHRPAIHLRLAALPGDGLAMAAAQPPDLVLLDIQLPVMDGFEVLRLLRQQPTLRHTPVVAVSANAMPDDLAAARAAGFADYLTKPLDMARLLAVVDRMLA